MKVGQLFRERMVATVKENVAVHANVFLLSYTRLSGVQMNLLRKDLRKLGARMYVSRNSLIRRALRDLPQQALAENVEGQTAIVWGAEDSVAVSKVLVKFAEDFKGISLRGGLLNGAPLAEGDIKTISTLPSREILLARLLGTILSPVSRLAGIFNHKTRDLLSIIKQLSEKKGGH